MCDTCTRRLTKVRTVSTRCHMAALASDNKLSSLFPRRSPHWLPLLEDIATSPAFATKMESMSTVLMQQDEWHYISMDATLKLCMKLMGQASYRSPKHVRDDAPFGDELAWRRLLTVRGRTGAVLMMQPLQNESAEQIVDALVQHFSVEQLGSVVHIGTDSPSEKLFTQLKVICPSMRSLLLDPIHLAIVYEYGFWNKKKSGIQATSSHTQKDYICGHQAGSGLLGCILRWYECSSFERHRDEIPGHDHKLIYDFGGEQQHPG